MPLSRSASADWRTELKNAWKILDEVRRDKIGTPWHLVIAGWDDGGHEQVLRSLVNSLQMQKSIHFIGPQYGPEKIRTFQAADAFILPSHSEGLPMAVLEAWSFKKPVFITDACNLKQAFQAQAAVRIVNNPIELSQQLETLLEGDFNLNAVAESGFEYFSQRYTWSSIVPRMIEMYRRAATVASDPKLVTTDF